LLYKVGGGKIITKPDVTPTELYQGREELDDKILLLHQGYEQVMALLANSQHFEAVLGTNQVLDIDTLRDINYPW
jgi:hypothetical protein